MHTKRPPAGPARAGFTLIELLTVIAIIGVLAAILIPVAGKVRESAKRSQCASNVRQITIGLVNYANQDRHQRFPSNAAGFWLWDLRKDSIKLVLGNAAPSVLYCPSGVKTVQENWNENRDYVESTYVLTTPGKWLAPEVETDRLRASYPQIINGETQQVPPSKRVLTADAVLHIGSVYINIPPREDRSNHMSGDMPAGGNIGFVDGHIEWRRFPQMNDQHNNAWMW